MSNCHWYSWPTAPPCRNPLGQPPEDCLPTSPGPKYVHQLLDCLDHAHQLDSDWEVPCTILRRLTDMVHRVRLQTHQHIVVLHVDRLAPYRGLSPSQSSRQRQPVPAHHQRLPAPVRRQR
ncbi:hypothetical protein SKAU_G00412070 [Synaphobranchus kaupii]|uniref:Uncharacterized protein n=1 Tax=Synaphobranchus kaupii TaxID=118154 RepID=A0A9Q1E7Y1_SYNKA|nr:hypothetical protein SKAU_G00412070 [Synaphobranchus kaupii]